MRRLVHLSDLHFGWNDDSLVRSLSTKVCEMKPDLTIVSGDFVEHATEEEFVLARNFLDALPQPTLVVPGNHDLPFYNFPLRMSQGLRLYRKYVSREMTPLYLDEEMAVIGVNTARIWPIRGGSINARQIADIESKLCPLPAEVTRILVTHHPFDLPPEYGGRYLVKRGQTALTRLACCLDILLAGHMHIGASGHVADRFETPNGSLVFSQAGTAISKRYKGEQNSFNLIELEHNQIRLTKFMWDSEASIYASKSEAGIYTKRDQKHVEG